MAERNQAEEMTRAADKFAESAQELAGALDRFLEYHQITIGGGAGLWAGERRSPRREPLSEEEAVELALKAEQEVRDEKAQPADWDPAAIFPAPSPDEVRQRRAERRKREAEEGDS